MTSDSASGGTTATISLPARSDSVPAARRWAREILARWGADELEWVTAQLLTEVVTNAVLHARTAFVVQLEHDAGRHAVRCVVTDTSPLALRVRHHTLEAATGRGLRMLEDLSDGWGVRPEAAGKSVWFEVVERALEDAPEPDLDALLLALDRSGAERAAHRDAEGATSDAATRPAVMNRL